MFAARNAFLTGVKTGISYKGFSSSTTTTITLPGHSAGDMIIIFASQTSSTTVPTVPSAGGTVPTWTNIYNNTTNPSFQCSYAIATDSSTTSGTWTNANVLVAAVISGQKATSPVGNSSFNARGATGFPLTANSVSLLGTGRALLQFYSINTSITGGSVAGYTKRIDIGSAALYTKDVTTTDGAVTFAASNTAPFISLQLQILE